MQVESAALSAGVAVLIDFEDGAGDGVVLEEAGEGETGGAAWGFGN